MSGWVQPRVMTPRGGQGKWKPTGWGRRMTLVAVWSVQVEHCQQKKKTKKKKVGLNWGQIGKKQASRRPTTQKRGKRRGGKKIEFGLWGVITKKQGGGGK